MYELTLANMTSVEAATETGALLWEKVANCLNYPKGTMFPSDGAGVDRAKIICRACPVTQFCLEYALANHIEHGVWGGTSERERHRLQKRRRDIGGAAINNTITDANIEDF